MREGISKAIIMSVVENSTVKLDNNGQECYQITENQLAKLTSDLKNKFIEMNKIEQLQASIGKVGFFLMTRKKKPTHYCVIPKLKTNDN